MMEELAKLLETGAEAESIQELVVDDNLLGKPTLAGRRLALQRVRELYALDRKVPLFRTLRTLWGREPQALPQLAMLAALARDPLLRATARPILELTPGSEFMRDRMRDAISTSVGARLNPPTLDKVVRNAASSWTQSGHLEGRTFKRRRRIEAYPASLALAIWLAQAAGFAGNDCLDNGWTAVLDLDAAGLRALLERARAANLVTVRQLGSHIEVDAGHLAMEVGA
jgi:hypothetical protein